MMWTILTKQIKEKQILFTDMPQTITGKYPEGMLHGNKWNG